MPGTSSATGNGASAPGVTARQIDVGALATLSGPVAADFAPIVPGVKAYLDMVNAHGGVYGRRIVLGHVADDGSNPTTDTDLARTLVEQDHVFAIVGVATAFFSAATFLAQSGTPTFGYATEPNWSPAPNLFAAYGSIIDYSSTAPFFAYVAKRLHAHAAGVISYGIPQSSAECRVAITAFHKYGIRVGYADLSVPYGSDLSSDVQHMKQAKVDFVVSCMDVPGNIELSRALQQYGVKGVHQLWLDGYDESTLHRYSSLMQGVYFIVEHVPFQASREFRHAFPGLDRYISVMGKYEPGYVDNEVAMDGWLSAALFVAGLRAAGPHPTQQGLVRAINDITDFTGGGLTTPVDWRIAHTTVTSPTCDAFVTVRGDRFDVTFNRGKDIWVCFPTSNPNVTHPVAPPPGSPGT